MNRVRTARRIVAILWVAVPAVLLSALIHTADSDVGGIAGLASPSVQVSVILWATPVVALTFLVLAVSVRSGPVVFTAVAIPASAVVSLFLVLAQSRPGTSVDDLWSFTGVTALVLAFLALAASPAKALGWPRRRDDDDAE